MRFRRDVRTRGIATCSQNSLQPKFFAAEVLCSQNSLQLKFLDERLGPDAPRGLSRPSPPEAIKAGSTPPSGSLSQGPKWVSRLRLFPVERNSLGDSPETGSETTPYCRLCFGLAAYFRATNPITKLTSATHAAVSRVVCQVLTEGYFTVTPAP